MPIEEGAVRGGLILRIPSDKLSFGVGRDTRKCRVHRVGVVEAEFFTSIFAKAIQ